MSLTSADRLEKGRTPWEGGGIGEVEWFAASRLSRSFVWLFSSLWLAGCSVHRGPLAVQFVSACLAVQFCLVCRPRPLLVIVSTVGAPCQGCPRSPRDRGAPTLDRTHRPQSWLRTGSRGRPGRVRRLVARRCRPPVGSCGPGPSGLGSFAGRGLRFFGPVGSVGRCAVATDSAGLCLVGRGYVRDAPAPS
jgi:hypothetical protein